MSEYGPATGEQPAKTAVRHEHDSYRLAAIEQFIARLAGASTWRRTSVSAFVTAGLILALTVHTLSVRQTVEVDPLVIENRHFGDASRGLERIQQEHYISIAELEEMTNDTSLDRYERMVFTYAPLILDDYYPVSMLETRDDVPIGVYYVYSVSTLGATELVHIEYWMYFSDENVGMPSPDRMARWGHPLDRELIYRINVLNDRVYNAEYQAPIHRLIPFPFPEEGRPIFRVASGNHNFQLVSPQQLETIQYPFRLLAPLPQYDRITSPLRDHDIMALAAEEALLQHGVDMTQYVYVGIENPAYVLREPYGGIVDVGVLVDGQWIHLRATIGHGIVVWGYRLIAIDLGFTPKPGDIEAVTLFIDSRDRTNGPPLRVAEVFVFPELRIQA
jgi:hypothetical protein